MRHEQTNNAIGTSIKAISLPAPGLAMSDHENRGLLHFYKLNNTLPFALKSKTSGLH